MTPTARDALQWFAASGPIGWFDRSAPSSSMRRRLVSLGLVEEVKEARRAFIDPTRFQLSQAGRDALAKMQGK